MDTNKKRPVQVIAMHGWAGDARCWRPWIEATASLGWQWQCGERGYGLLAPCAPAWPDNLAPGVLRVVIAHSLGPHLLARDIWPSADAVVLLASFGTFVPPDRAGRRVRSALDGMAAKLDSETSARRMLETFLANAAHPEPSDLLPPSPIEGSLHLDRLRSDLEILRHCQGLPHGFPTKARVLIVEAGADRIVDSEARAMLRAALPEADVVELPSAGHALLGAQVVSQVADGVESRR